MTENRQQIAPVGTNLLSLEFGNREIDLSNLTPEARAEVEKYAAMKKIDIRSSVEELQRDLQATTVAMNNVADVTRRMSESGDAVTVRQTINNAAGKIEVLAGNTSEAQSGKVSSTDDKTWMYLIGGVVAAILAAMIMSGR